MSANIGTRSRATAKASKRRPVTRSGPSEDEVRILAYHLYERRQVDGVTGDAASDWSEAERLLWSAQVN